MLFGEDIVVDHVWLAWQSGNTQTEAPINVPKHFCHHHVLIVIIVIIVIFVIFVIFVIVGIIVIFVIFVNTKHYIAALTKGCSFAE